MAWTAGENFECIHFLCSYRFLIGGREASLRINGRCFSD